MADISTEELEELRRLTLVEQSVIAGLREGGFSEKALEFFRYRKIFLLPYDPLKDTADVVGKFELQRRVIGILTILKRIARVKE